MMKGDMGKAISQVAEKDNSATHFGVDLWMISASSFGSTVCRCLRRVFSVSKVLTTVSVIRSCVSAEPPRMVNCSAEVMRLCPSWLSRPSPNKWALFFADVRRGVFFISGGHGWRWDGCFQRLFLNPGADDIGKSLVLLKGEFAQAGEFQHGEEAGDQAAQGDFGMEQAGKGEASLGLQVLQDIFHLVGDRDLLGVDLPDHEFLGESSQRT